MDPDGTEGGADLTGGEPVVQQDTAPVGNQQAPTGENPAWAELLGVLPSSLHQTVKPYLEKWDRGVNDRFTRVQSQYDPYKDFLTVDPQQIQASLQLAQLVATDPRSFYDKMTDYYGAEWGLGQGQGDDDADDYSLDDGEDEDYDPVADNPLFQKLQEQQDTIANFLASDLQRKEQEQYQQEVEKAGSEIDNAFKSVATKFQMAEVPTQAQQMILSLCMTNEGITIEQAAEQVMPLFAGQNRPAPRIMSPGGGVPANNVDPAKMSGTETRSAVAAILAQAHANQT